MPSNATRARAGTPALLVALLMLSLLAACGSAAPVGTVTVRSAQAASGGPLPPQRGLPVPLTQSAEVFAPVTRVPLPTLTPTPGSPAGGLAAVLNSAAPGDEAEAASAVDPSTEPEEAAEETAGESLPFDAVTAITGAQRAPVEAPAPLPDAPVSGPVTVLLDAGVPEPYAALLRDALDGVDSLAFNEGTQPVRRVESDATTQIGLAAPNSGGTPIVQRYFAAVVPFDTVQDGITLADVAARWQGDGAVYTTREGLELLPVLLGAPAASTTVVTPEELIGLLEADRSALGLIPFDQLDPRFKPLAVDGAQILSNQLAPGAYPLEVQISASGAGKNRLAQALAGAVEPATNRDPNKLTTLVMTGVTAMSRGTADAMERRGYTYPAEIIGPELALADITHISNEVPFLEDCVVNNTLNNLTLCSDTTYWAALELMGTDIVGLSGNHVNDFGRDGARESLGWYAENGIPIYGSGLTVDEACAPLLWAHNGNTFAFIAALAYGPESAWVTDEEPGACYYYEHQARIFNTIRLLADTVDIVAVELQYEETYFPFPTAAQVEEFRALRAQGADLVTGVQSHVPQAQEPYGAVDEGGPGFISYGLGNLFFDQMWSWETRTELYARHAIYEGRMIGTEILTGVLEDFAQPRWTTPQERAALLQTLFDNAPTRP